MKLTTQQQRLMRHRRIRTKVKGSAARPRLSIYRGARSLIVQLIDDQSGKTLFYLTDQSKGKKITGTPVARAAALGKKVGEALKAQGVTVAVFDRGGWRYHGRIKVFAEAVREAGIKL